MMIDKNCKQKTHSPLFFYFSQIYNKRHPTCHGDEWDLIEIRRPLSMMKGTNLKKKRVADFCVIQKKRSDLKRRFFCSNRYTFGDCFDRRCYLFSYDKNK
jgi:hypothetical protein